MRRTRAPVDVLGVEPRIFVQAQKIIVARAERRAPSAALLASRRLGAVPLAPFVTLHDSLLATFRKRLGLSGEVAAGLAAEIERQAVDLAGLAPEDYARTLGLSRPDAAARAAALRAATDQMWRESRIDRAFEVPYVAGYDKDAGAYVFIDCAAPMQAQRGGATIPVGPLLVIHERVEKAVLLDDRSVYPSAHQIALRIEKAAAQAMGVDWKAYDNVITELSDAISARKAPRNISDRLDLQPYYTFLDADNRKLVAGMEKALTAHAPAARPAAGPELDPAPVCGTDGTPTK